ncbi:unknown [Sutterella wadsworthensis CAG:135]|nr:unknown [Sutterella wadsworthensis CAG:135]
MRAEKIIRKTVVLNLLRRQQGRFSFLSLPFFFYGFNLK